MKPRNPATDPQPRDVLSFKNWTVTVLNFDGAIVFYEKVSANQGAIAYQTLEEWRQWSHLATVEKAAGVVQECTVTTFVGGRCQKCGDALQPAHLSADGILCGNGCCQAIKHVAPKKKARKPDATPA